MVWDAEKAVLEVEHFEDAVILLAQTALRNAIGKNELGDLLSDRDRLGREIQKVLDEKTNAWGVTTESVEIRDIIIPPALEDAMSRQAQAERERQSRIILGSAETEIAEKFAQASEHYQHNPVALHLRAMNMVYEGLRQKGSMVIVPSSAVETMGLGALGGSLVFDPQGTLAFYRRVIYSTHGRIRLLGLGLVVLVAVPMVVTARDAPLAQAGVTVWLQGLGWLGGVAGLLVMAAPGFCKRMVESTLFDFPDAVLRVLGVVNIAFGLFLGWVAFAVL
jgi:uncharacterized protein YjeT (DUF2065 family)